jgi:hypothetical protein
LNSPVNCSKESCSKEFVKHDLIVEALFVLSNKELEMFEVVGADVFIAKEDAS